MGACRRLVYAIRYRSSKEGGVRVVERGGVGGGG